MVLEHNTLLKKNHTKHFHLEDFTIFGVNRRSGVLFHGFALVLIP